VLEQPYRIIGAISIQVVTQFFSSNFQAMGFKLIIVIYNGYQSEKYTQGRRLKNFQGRGGGAMEKRPKIALLKGH